MSLENHPAQSGAASEVFVDFVAQCRRCNKPFLIPMAVDHKAATVYVAKPVPLNCRQIQIGDTVCPHCSAPYEKWEDAVRQVVAALPSEN